MNDGMPGEEPWRAHTFSTGDTASQRPAGGRAQGGQEARSWGAGEPGRLWLSLPILQPHLVVGPSGSELLELNPWHSQQHNHLVAPGILEPSPVNKCLSQLGPYREVVWFTPETHSRKETALPFSSLPHCPEGVPSSLQPQSRPACWFLKLSPLRSSSKASGLEHSADAPKIWGRLKDSGLVFERRMGWVSLALRAGKGHCAHPGSPLTWYLKTLQWPHHL